MRDEGCGMKDAGTAKIAKNTKADCHVHQWMPFGCGLSLRGCRGIKAPCVSRLEAGRKGGEPKDDG